MPNPDLNPSWPITSLGRLLFVLHLLDLPYDGHHCLTLLSLMLRQSWLRASPSRLSFSFLVPTCAVFGPAQCVKQTCCIRKLHVKRKDGLKTSFGCLKHHFKTPDALWWKMFKVIKTSQEDVLDHLKHLQMFQNISQH
jgi:hypothetical protein